MPEWLDGIFGSVRCANCGKAYERGDVTVVGNRDEYWFLRCVCSNCGTQGIGVVWVKEIEVKAEEKPVTKKPFTVDDVLTAHEILRDYQGDAPGLVTGRDPS